MHALFSLLFLAFAPAAYGYAWVANQAGVDPSLLKEARYAAQKRQTSCPFNANHQDAAPYSAAFPYTGARNGLPGTGNGGIKVSVRDCELK
jgi:hypothetical protein